LTIDSNVGQVVTLHSPGDAKRLLLGLPLRALAVSGEPPELHWAVFQAGCGATSVATRDALLRRPKTSQNFATKMCGIAVIKRGMPNFGCH
jgi:hypothetical protein